MSRVCTEVQAQLPAWVDDRLATWRRRLVDRHVGRCATCSAALVRQEELAAGLEALSRRVTAPAAEAPPPELLDQLLDHAGSPGVRARAAVPARGAVSGARPAWSVALVVLVALVGTATGYALWRAGRRVRRVLHREPTGPARRR